jgi:hypothetical protein
MRRASLFFFYPLGLIVHVQSSSSSEPPHPAALRAAGCGGTRWQSFHSWQICRSLGARYGPSLDVYGPVWGWLAAGQE